MSRSMLDDTRQLLLQDPMFYQSLYINTLFHPSVPARHLQAFNCPFARERTLMFTLIASGEIYDPVKRGTDCLLVAGDSIARVGPVREKDLDALRVISQFHVGKKKGGMKLLGQLIDDF